MSRHFTQFTQALSNPGRAESFTPEAVAMLADAAYQGWVVIDTPEQEWPADELFDKGYVDWRLGTRGDEAIVLTRKGKDRVAAALEKLSEARAHQGASLWADTLRNPSEAEGAGLGAGAGALLLGPVGALAGGYFGAKATRKKKKSKKNPTHPRKRSSAMRRLLRGT